MRSLKPSRLQQLQQQRRSREREKEDGRISGGPPPFSAPCALPRAQAETEGSASALQAGEYAKEYGSGARGDGGGGDGGGHGTASRLFPCLGSPPAHKPALARNDNSSAEKVLRKVASRFNNVASALDPRNLISSPAISRVRRWGVGGDIGGDREERDVDEMVDGIKEEGEEDEEEEEEDRPRGTVDLYMYSFGAPRVGNPIYSDRYNEVVPHSFRVVVDGDPVPVSRCFFSLINHDDAVGRLFVVPRSRR